MDGSAVIAILFRWLHVVAAALAIGGVFFVRVILPVGLRTLDETSRTQVMLACRRVFKMVIHTCILLLLVSGIYNSIRLFPQYRVNPPLLHGLWGGHILLGLCVFGISLWLLSGKQPPASAPGFMTLNLVLLLILVAVASSLKTAREMSQHTSETRLSP
jgi:uncharacterized membrane protein